jgi:hypothetical protein
MSIVDSTTTLDTAWTEQSTVAFTAGTLASITECTTEVGTKLKRGTISATTTPTETQVQQWLIRAKQELSEIKNFTWRRRFATASTVSTTFRYALPPDYNGGEVSLRDTGNTRTIIIWPRDWFETKYPDPSNESAGEPQVACIKGLELWLCPPPDGIYTLELEYDRSGDDNTASDMSWLPEIERFRCCDYAVSEAFESLHQWQESQLFRQKWHEGLMKARRADGKRKWKSMNYAASSVLEKHNALKYQPSSLRR